MSAHDDVLTAKTARGVLHHGECLRQNLHQFRREFGVVFDLGKLRFPRRRLGAELVVGKRLQSLLNLVDAGDDRTDFLHLTIVAGRKNGS